MKTIAEEPAPAGIGVNDILFILYRHKWMILASALVGLAGALTLYFLKVQEYESRAKLMVRYVIDRSAVDSLDPKVNTSGPQMDTIINSEVEILTSLDLAIQVVESLGAERVMPKSAGGAAGKAGAVKRVLGGLKVEFRRGSNVIAVSYRSDDPEMARAVLDELVKRYFDKHLEVHRSTGAFSFVTDQTQQARSRLRLTQDDLQKRKVEAGIFSLADSMAGINVQLARSEEGLLLAETELAVQQARVKEMEALLGGGFAGEPGTARDNEVAASAFKPPENRNASAPQTPKARGDREGPAANRSEAEQYRLLVEQLAQLRQTELAFLTRFTPESQFVQSIRRQIEPLESQCRDLEKRFPELIAASSIAISEGRPQTDIVTEKTNLAASTAKVDSLKAQLHAIREQATRLAKVSPQIAELEQKKELEEAKLKYMESGLDKARIDEALDPSKIPNISIVQQPSIGAAVTGESQKPVLGLAGGGLGLGVLIALLIELVLNRSVRRPSELETRLRIPQLVSIPYFPGPSNSRRRLKKRAGDSDSGSDKPLESGALSVAPWAPDHFIRTFSEEIRDRLILAFRLKSLTHKPKLVGIAGLSGGEGTSTLAGGLAASLSETGDGKVLLVDMNLRSSATHPFQDGKPACGLAEALEANGSLPPASENLYLATASSGNGGLMQLAAKRFYALVPDLKASHFDYIIFDLPPVTQGSATLAIAGCLDKLLFVVEAEKSERNEVKRAYSDLVAAKADVSGILNKTRISGPRWLNS